MDSRTTPEKAALRAAAAAVGGQAALAADIGLPDRRHIWPYFKTARKLPPELCVSIEQATRAKGRVVRRWDLRPEDWHRIWPELVGTVGAPEIPADAVTPSKD